MCSSRQAIPLSDTDKVEVQSRLQVQVDSRLGIKFSENKTPTTAAYTECCGVLKKVKLEAWPDLSGATTS
jgi:hypothetical protein